MGWLCAVAYLNEGVVDIGRAITNLLMKNFTPFAMPKKMGPHAVVDGEIIVVNDDGMPDFSDLQLWRSEADGQLAFYILTFMAEGFNVMNLPLGSGINSYRPSFLKKITLSRSVNNSIRREKIFFPWPNN
jgi:bifunctional non-homologous end joining protein LigD